MCKHFVEIKILMMKYLRAELSAYPIFINYPMLNKISEFHYDYFLKVIIDFLNFDFTFRFLRVWTNGCFRVYHRTDLIYKIKIT